jgi:hypothetical protein
MSLTQFLTLVLVWFLYRLARSPRNPALWAVVTCIAFQLLGATTVVAYIRTLFDDMPASSILKLLMNLALNISRYGLMMFFLISTGGSRLRAKVEGAVLVAVCAAMATAVLILPSGMRNTAYPSSGSLPQNMGILGVAPFYIIGGGYTVYATVQTARWALRYANESSRRARLGLRGAAVGLCCYAIAAALRTVVTIIRWAGQPGFATDLMATTNRLIPLGTYLFLIGVCYVGLAARLAALRVWIRHRRIYHELWPLWAQLHHVFPSDELDRMSTPRWLDRLLPQRVSYRYWRRVIEIRDGLVQLSPQLVDAGFDPSLPAENQIDNIQTALSRQSQGHTPQSQTAVMVAAPEALDINSDVQQLVRLARALAQKGTT